MAGPKTRKPAPRRGRSRRAREKEALAAAVTAKIEKLVEQLRARDADPPYAPTSSRPIR
ncbi:hypothetical protein V7S57_19125 [Caulobacter sp. CCNWLY153]|jgi:hypothetical protein|uniref:hypothetical protein n=1 Tax=unclassified Caulobacter TaxID=2648921 RepID=UPI00269F030C